MTNNVLALQLKANVEEFESKKQDLKRLRGMLQSFVDEVAHGREVRYVAPTLVTLAPYGNHKLEVEVRFGFRNNSASVACHINLIAAGIEIDRDEQFQLEIVRLAWDNMDILIEAVRKVCKDLGCENALNAKFVRFMMKFQ